MLSNVVARIPMLIQWRDIRVVSPQVLLGIFAYCSSYFLVPNSTLLEFQGAFMRG